MKAHKRIRHTTATKNTALSMIKQGVRIKSISEMLDIPAPTISNWKAGRNIKFFRKEAVEHLVLAQEDTKMNKLEAFKALANGEKVRVYTWDKDYHLYLDDGGNIRSPVNTKEVWTSMPWDNWEIYTEPKYYWIYMTTNNETGYSYLSATSFKDTLSGVTRYYENTAEYSYEIVGIVEGLTEAQQYMLGE